jgi:hypothetical protein
MKLLEKFKGQHVVILTKDQIGSMGLEGNESTQVGYFGFMFDEDSDFIYLGDDLKSQAVNKAVRKNGISYISLCPESDIGESVDILNAIMDASGDEGGETH